MMVVSSRSRVIVTKADLMEAGTSQVSPAPRSSNVLQGLPTKGLTQAEPCCTFEMFVPYAVKIIGKVA